MRDLFPPLDPNLTGMMRVDNLHTLYWEESGNPQGTPVVFLHGGPGAGTNPTQRRFFDPDAYRIILFDQRGAGRSRPHAEVRDNTIEHLIRDIEQLRVERGVERWHVFGGSWGSTLAIAYAEQHPDRCLSLTLRGIFLMQQREIDWFLYGLSTIFPEEWEKFASLAPPGRRNDLLNFYSEIFESRDDEVRLRALKTWANYESMCSTLLPAAQKWDDLHQIGLARIEAHYFKNSRLNPDTKLLDNIGRVRAIPATIVQGRYDVICPIITADELHRAWPEAKYIVVPGAGHAAMEPGVKSALIEATEQYKGMR